MIRILIVEDEEPIANLIRMNLTRAGYQCEIAPDGELAADRIENQSYDLILLDIMLPKLDGYEVLEYAMAVDIPVIFLTAMGETAQKVKGLRMGIISPSLLKFRSFWPGWRRCCAAAGKRTGGFTFLILTLTRIPVPYRSRGNRWISR